MNAVSSETSVTYSYSQKLKLKETIEKNLEQKELIEILKILVNHNVKISQNYTGVLFDLKYVDNNILEKIEKYVNFCSDNRKNQLENDNLKLSYKKELKPEKYEYTNTLENTIQPLSNLYQKYSNIENNDTNDIPTYNVIDKNVTQTYKVNVTLSNSKSKNKKTSEYKKNLIKFNDIVNKKNTENDTDIDSFTQDECQINDDEDITTIDDISSINNHESYNEDDSEDNSDEESDEESDEDSENISSE